MGNTKIEYATKVWNPVTGCTPISAGCDNCWAQAYLNRWKQPKTVTLHPKRLDEPLKWKKPQVVFVCSQSDLFHDDVAAEMQTDIYQTMAACPQHIFLILTKRPVNMLERVSMIARIKQINEWFHNNQQVPWPLPNVWLGVSVEDQATADDRIPKLLSIPAAHHWVSIEPMLGPVDLGDILHGSPTKDSEDGEWYQTHPPPDGIVVGGESGLGARPMHPDWPRKIRDDCKAAGVPFFFKQWGEHEPLGPTKPKPSFMAMRGVMTKRWSEVHDYAFLRIGKKKAGNILDGEKWDQTPWGEK